MSPEYRDRNGDVIKTGLYLEGGPDSLVPVHVFEHEKGLCGRYSSMTEPIPLENFRTDFFVPIRDPARYAETLRTNARFIDGALARMAEDARPADPAAEAAEDATILGCCGGGT